MDLENTDHLVSREIPPLFIVQCFLNVPWALFFSGVIYMRVKNGLSQIEEYYTTRINHTQDLAKILEETNIKYREQSIEAVNQSTEYHKKYEESKRRLIDLVGPDFEDL